jgi:acetyl esterase/lipase
MFLTAVLLQARTTFSVLRRIGGSRSPSHARPVRVFSVRCALGQRVPPDPQKYTAIDYRLAPESRFPGPLHDAASAYFRLVDELGVRPENILVAGDSAGGGLTLALLMYLRDNSYPLPAGAILMSPWVGASGFAFFPARTLQRADSGAADLTLSCDSWDRNAPYDIIPRPMPGDSLDPVACYLGAEHVASLVTHPYASPLFGDFRGLPPLLVQTGEVEVLRDEHDLLAAKARRAGVQVVHETYEDCVGAFVVSCMAPCSLQHTQIHVFQAFWFFEAIEKAFAACRRFVHDVVPSAQAHAPATLARLQAELDAHQSLPPTLMLRIGRERAATNGSTTSDATLVGDDDDLGKEQPRSQSPVAQWPRTRTRGSGDGPRWTPCVQSSFSTLPARKAARAMSHPDVASLWALAMAPVAAVTPSTTRGRRRAGSSPHAYMSPYAMVA